MTKFFMAPSLQVSFYGHSDFVHGLHDKGGGERASKLLAPFSFWLPAAPFVGGAQGFLSTSSLPRQYKSALRVHLISN